MVAASAHQPPLRLTRRGRAVVLVLFVLLASAASAVLFSTASRASDPETTTPPRTVVVGVHDTLWAIATRAEPRWDPYAAVAEIQRLNGMRDYTVEPGDTLILPRAE